MHLLVSAEVSARIHCPDRTCAEILEKCISRLSRRYGLSRSDLGDKALRESSHLPALVRLLTYAQADLIESLKDRQCADLLAECIGHLTRIHRFSTEPADQDFLSVPRYH
jgi:hypothetical protein